MRDGRSWVVLCGVQTSWVILDSVEFGRGRVGCMGETAGWLFRTEEIANMTSGGKVATPAWWVG